MIKEEKPMRNWVCYCLAVFALMSSTLVQAKEMMLNFKDADIEAVITTVSEITGKNFIIDPRVKGKVTMISSEPMDTDALYQTFLALLNVHDFAAVPSGDVIKILPAASAKQAAGTVANGQYSGPDEGYVTRIIHVENVNALELVPILRPLLPQEAHLAAVAQSNVLITNGLAGNVARIAKIVERIDRNAEGDVEVIRLSHAAAPEIVKILKTLDPVKKRAGNALNIVADERTNSVLLSGPESQRLRYRAVIAHLDTPLENEGGVEVIYLNYANAKDLAQVLVGISQGIKEQADKGGNAPGNSKEIQIQADESTNSLVINAAPSMMRELKSVVRKLDFRRAQVHVEAVIAEVSSETASELGVQWGFQANDKLPAGVVNFSGSGSGILDLAANVSTGSIPKAVDGLTVGLGNLTGGNVSIAAVIRALSADANNNILATPSLMTLDNEEAEIVVGQEVPLLTGSYTSTGTGSTPSNPFQTYERKDVGLTLKVQPQINEGDAVRLTIVQEVSTINSTTLGAADLVTNKRRLSTTVMVDDGKMIVLGGLIDESLVDGEQSVPVLGDVPVLGNLFRYGKTKKKKTNLMVFLRPTIVRDAVQASTVAGGKYDYIRSQQLAAKKPVADFLPRGEVPLMPEWKDAKDGPGTSSPQTGGEPPNTQGSAPSDVKPFSIQDLNY